MSGFSYDIPEIARNLISVYGLERAIGLIDDNIQSFTPCEPHTYAAARIDHWRSVRREIVHPRKMK